jgi:lipopolysaccharide transport system permease protein
MWSVITESLSEPLSAFKSNQNIVTKINFSKEALVILAYFNLLYRMSFKLLMVVFLMVFFRVAPSATILLFVPMLLVSMVTLVSIGVILMPVEIMLPDFSKFKTAFFTLLMYATPVVYAKPKSGVIAELVKWNPCTYLIDGLRNSLTGQAIHNPMFWGTLCIVALIAFMVGTIVFRVAAPIIIQRLSA